MSFKVQSRMCSTCIYRPDSPLDIKSLEAQVADPKMPRFFAHYRACHHSIDEPVCCRGFWDRHKNDFAAGQLAQRQDAVEFVWEDTL